MMKSLIVEDDYSSQLLLQGILGQFGDPEVASDGVEALRLFERELSEGRFFDVVCLDINMPRMNGFSTLAEMRSLEKTYGIDKDSSARVIITSALDHDEVQNTGTERTLYDAYLNKPIRKTKLESLLRVLGAL